jgi:two-component system, LytTR family, response regulator
MNNYTPHFCEITNDKIHFIRSKKRVFLKEIVMFRANINYTAIHLLSGKVMLIPRTIKIFEELLSDYAFVRTHRAYLINELHLKEYDFPNNCVKLSNNMTALISRRRKDAFEHCKV